MLRVSLVLACPPDRLRAIAMLGSPPDCLHVAMVAEEGLEPPTRGL